MALILHIETATEVCSVALARDGQVLAERFNDEGRKHAQKLTPFIQEVLAESDVKMKDLDAVAVSKGPGSYTGLRIGVSVAKGLCFAASLPLLSVNTLYTMADAARQQVQEEALFCPMIDARRMEVYHLLMDSEGEVVTPTNALVVEEDTFLPLLEKQPVYFFGDGMPKLREMLGKHEHARFLDIQADAKHLVRPALEYFRQQQFEDILLFEPFYLKDFVAGKPGEKLRRVLGKTKKHGGRGE